MAIFVQPTGGHSLDSAGRLVLTYSEQGLYADVLASAKARPRGTLITNVGYVLQWTINRQPGNNGIVTYSCVDQTSESYEGNDPIADQWLVRHTQTAIPLMRYCGPSEVNNAYWYDIRKWKAETDYNRFQSYQYLDDSGILRTLSEFSQKLAAKIKLGMESVMRFYPVVTHIRIYSKEPTDDVGGKLSYIDTPTEYGDIAPVFLKIQDDISPLADGTIQRTEAWQGADDLDANLYGSGADRWAFGTI